MANPIKNLKIVDVPQGGLKEGMRLAETFTYGYAEQRNAESVFSARFGKPLDAKFVQIFNNLPEHPEIVRRRQVKKEDGRDTAPVQVFETTAQTVGWIEAFAQDFMVRERATEELKDYRRRGGGAAIIRLDNVMKQLFKDVDTSTKDVHELIKTKTKGHNALDDLLRDVEFRRQIQEGILDPLAESPLINTYLSYAPHEREHALDVTTLTVRAAIETGVVDKKILYDLAIASMMHDIGRRYLIATTKKGGRIAPEVMNLHAIYLVEKILAPGDEPLDALTSRQLNLMKHSHTRRDGYGPKEPTPDKRGRIYVGRDIGINDRSDLLLKIAGWKRKLEEDEPHHPYIAECPESYSDIVALSEHWFTGITEGTTRLEAGKLLEDIREDSGLFAKSRHTEPFLNILERGHFA